MAILRTRIVSKKHYVHAVLIITLLAPLSSISSEIDDVLLDIYGDDNLISIASGMAEPIHKAPSVASVISREQIDDIGAITLEEALGMVLGVHVSRYVIANNPIYVFRGLYSQFNQQVLLLIDGQPMTRLFNRDRGTTWGDMPLAAVQRIEIIHGPGSAIYGADAFAGVINVITTKPQEGSNISGFQAGGSDSFYAWHHQNFSLFEHPANFTLEYRHSSGRERLVEIDGQSALDNLIGTQASNAPNTTNLDLSAWDARLSADLGNWLLNAGLQIRSDLGTGLGSSSVLDPLGRQSAQRATIQLKQTPTPTRIDNLNATIALHYSFSADEQNVVLYPPGTVTALGPGITPSLYADGVIGSPSAKEWDFRFEHSFVYTGWENHRLRFDYGFYFGDLFETSEIKNFDAAGAALPNLQDVSDDPSLVYLLPHDVFVRYALLENRWAISPSLETTMGLRLDDYSNFGSTTNPRASIVWQIDDNSTIKFLYGRAFRSPSFAELYIINNPVIEGDPTLEPEIINSYDISFIERMGFSSQLTLNVFFNEIDDPIDLQADTNGKLVFSNISGLKSRGVNIGYDTEFLLSHRLNAGFAYQSVERQSTGNDIGRYPRRNLYTNYTWEIDENWRLGALWRWVSDRNRTEADPRAPLDGYDVLDVKITRKWSPAFSTSLLIKNSLDEDIREPTTQITPLGVSVPNDLPLDRRIVIFEIRYTNQDEG